MATTTETLINAGGKEWQASDKHRIYFNASVINKIAGFTFHGKDTRQDGETISRNQAFKHVMSEGCNVKFYYDVTSDKFCSTCFVSKDTHKRAVDYLSALISDKTTKKDKKAVMTRAWVIAKEAQAKFGGKSSQYLSGALKAAWAE